MLFLTRNLILDVQISEGDGDGSDDEGAAEEFLGRLQPPSYHAQGFNIPFGQPLTPTYRSPMQVL